MTSQLRILLVLLAFVQLTGPPLQAQSVPSQEQLTAEIPNGPSGQIWKHYDLKPYLDRCEDQQAAAQNAIDWVLRQTGTDIWFQNPPGMIYADERQLHVFHVQSVLNTIDPLVERLLRAHEHSLALRVRVVSVDSPSWRRIAAPHMQPLDTQTPGLQAWMLAPEAAAVLMNHLQSRADFRSYTSQGLLIPNGQTNTLSHWQPRVYPQRVRGFNPVDGSMQVQMEQISEGFSLTISPLANLGAQNMEVAVRCRVQMIEAMSSFRTQPAAGRSATMQVPQISNWDLNDRLVWPRDQVLLLSRGIVGMPGSPNTGMSSLSRVVPLAKPRAEALVFLAVEALERQEKTASQMLRTGSLQYRGRY